MNKDRETAMLMAAAILDGPIENIPRNDLDAMLKHGYVRGSFICGVRWGDRNPESPWVNISEWMPEDSLPELPNTELRKKDIKAIILFKDGRIMEGHRRISTSGIWFWNIPIRMREDITHWMPIPPVPPIIDDLT